MQSHVAWLHWKAIAENGRMYMQLIPVMGKK